MPFPILTAVAVATVLAAGPVAAQAHPPETGLSAETREAWADFVAFTEDEREAAADAGRDLLNAIDRDLERLDARADEATGEAREVWIDRRQDLAARRDAVAEDLDRLTDESGDGWDSLQDGFADAYDELSDAVSDAWNDLNS